MIIPIPDTDFRLAGNANAWTIQRRKKRKAGDAWEPIAWYTNLEAAVQGLAERQIRTAEAETLSEPWWRSNASPPGSPWRSPPVSRAW